MILKGIVPFRSYLFFMSCSDSMLLFFGFWISLFSTFFSSYFFLVRISRSVRMELGWNMVVVVVSFIVN